MLGLGTAWILDGLGITIASPVTSKLTQASTLNLPTAQAASIGTVYLVGEVFGALVFGRLSGKLVHRNLFMWTLAIYLDVHLDRRVLLRLRRGKRRLPDGQRDLPVETRAEAIAVFFAIAQIFGALGTIFYGALIGSGSNRAGLTIGYLTGGGVMIIGGLVELFLGINAEGKPLEQVARPLTEVGSGPAGRGAG